jgi:hypothetical protein
MPLTLGQSIIGPTLAITFVILGLLLSLMGSWMLCRALWPNRVERAAERCAARPILSFIVGLPIVIATVWISGGLAKLAGPPGSILAMLLLTVGYFYSSVGTAGLATHVGKRLESPVDDLRPWRATLRGGLTLALSFLVPFIGALVVLPIAIMVGTGANTLSFFARRKPLAPPPLDDALSARMSGGIDPATFGARREQEALR